jgi:hypothetical protein
MNIVRKYQGNSWDPAVVITSDGVAKDCTGLDCVLIIKRDDLINASAVILVAITWTNQAGGLGTFAVTPAQTLALETISYSYEVILYDLTYQRTCNKGKLEILPSLGTS